MKVKAYQNYFGGKNGNGTYQQIINKIPPHDVFMSLFLGNCAITRYIKPAKQGFLNDLDPDVVQAWEKVPLPWNYALSNRNALDELAAARNENRLTDRTFIYLDPPYPLFTRKSKVKVYNFEMTDKGHRDLLSLIFSMKPAKIMISSYPNDLYDEMLSGWNTYDFYSTIRNGVALERIYYNYDLTDQLHDYSFLGDDFRERERNTRIIKNMVKKLHRLEPSLRNAVIEAITV